MKRPLLNERDLKAFRVFKAVVESNGFTAAEKKLCMTTASISRHIKEIEERIGIRLCTRGPQGFAMTEAGEAALERIQDALDAIDRILPAIDKTRSVLSGNLTIGVLDSIIENPQCHFGESLDRFIDIAPDVEIMVQTITKDDVVKSIINHKFHIILDGQRRPSDGLVYEYLFDEKQTLYYCPIKNEKYHELPVVMRPVQKLLHELIDKYQYKKGPSADGLQSVAFLISTGRFIGLLPQHYADQMATVCALQRVPDAPVFTIPFYAVINPARPLPLCAERFVQILKECHT